MNTPNLIQHPFTRSIVFGLLAGFAAQAIVAGVNTVGFGDPSDTLPMDDAWIQQAVSYDDKLGEVDMVVSLGQQTYPALKDFIEAYAQQHQLKIVVQAGSCGVTAKKLAHKSVDIGAYCCPPGKTDRLPGIRFHTLGIAPIALVTSPANPVTNLSLQQARDIFSGKTMQWSEVPAEQGKGFLTSDVQPIARMHCKKRPGHWRGLLENQDMFSPRVREVGVVPDMIREVAGSDSNIGYETLYMLDVYRDKGELKALSIDGMHPSDLKTMVDARYPIYRTYNLTTWPKDGNADKANALVAAISHYIETDGEKFGIVPASALRTAGWKFNGDELVGEPGGSMVFSERE